MSWYRIGRPKRLGFVFLVGALVLTAGLGAAPRQKNSTDVETEVGNLPLILSAPHGGESQPDAIPDRTGAVVVNDWGSQDLARALAAEVEVLTGRRPHLIVNHLHRSKLDPNRSLDHGAQGDPRAERARSDYHASIREGARAVVDECGWGLYVDLHSFGEWGRGVEIGYGLTADQLHEDDQDLSKRRFVYTSNLRNAALYTGRSLVDLIRGSASLGGLLEAQGYWAVPSPEHPEPASGYFDGGYSVYRHGPRRGGGVDAVQIEVPYNLLRPEARERFAGALAITLVDFLEEHYRVRARADVPCTGYADLDWDHWAFDSIQLLRDAGRILPCQSDPARLCPDAELDRAAAAELIWRAMYGDHAPPDGFVGFMDLQNGEAARVVGALWREGYLNSCARSPWHFCPEQPMTRADMAAVALRVRSGPAVIPPPPTGLYEDAPRGDWSSWWLEAALQRDLIPACPTDGPFACPNRPVTRAEAVWVMARASEPVR
ncbi:MAG: hypothetical protein R3191_06235 [Anaerolineales bacterium]|nr:hypothetical protein [Anaerolineales bacterium]